jgi:hypothetical protein
VPCDLRLYLWAHEDLNLGPLPCQSGAGYGLTCGDDGFSLVGLCPASSSLAVAIQRFRAACGPNVAG